MRDSCRAVVAAVTGWVLCAGGAGPAGASAPAGADGGDGPLDLAQRIRAYQPYDGAGRYAMAKDDGVRGIQGLRALAARGGVKPYALLSAGPGAWRTERVIFKDVDTGATVCRLTYDQWGRFDLDAGPHTLTIQNKSGKTIEKVLITNDRSLSPAGHVNILSGW